MAKAKAHRAKRLSSANHTIIIVVIILVCVGLWVLFMENKKAPEISQEMDTPVIMKNSADIGPDQGCNLVDTNYVCDIKINNPAEKDLAWTARIDGIEGATVSEETGLLGPTEQKVIQLTVPQDFCTAAPKVQGNVVVSEDNNIDNQAKTIFDCSLKAE